MKSESNAPIHKLIELVKQELLRMGYGDQVIKRYQTVWSRLTEHMKEPSITAYNTKIGLDFLESAYQITVF
jgi:hypothetical protein